MKAKVNIELLKTTTFDSGALGMLAMVIHQFGSAGRYRVTVLHEGRALADLDFEVNEKSEEMQLDIDLAQAVRNAKARPEDCGCKSEKQMVGVVSPKGYVLFHASSGHGYSVIVLGREGRVAFDSTKLGEGDLFAVSLLEPATYSLKNKTGSATGEIVVTTGTDKRMKALETHHIEASPKKFNTKRIELSSSQGLVFRIKDSARILIEKEHTQTDKRNKPVIRWQSLRTIRKEASK
ncbi:MAG TPA: hypothetical protein VFF78_02455 [Anaerolineaceae bacterium]|nr:hypothetical protein [Anaerolineaceae bacterium]